MWYNTLSTEPISSLHEPNLWISKGIKFYCYTTEMPSLQLQPIRQYWTQSILHSLQNITLHMYLLTNETEPETQPGWTYNKILMYALPVN